MAVSLGIDWETGDIIASGYEAVYTTDPTPEILLAVGVPLGSFAGDPGLGSRLPLLIQGQPVNDPAEFELATREALQPLENSGLITGVDVAVDTVSQPGTVIVSVSVDQLVDPLEFEVT